MFFTVKEHCIGEFISVCSQRKLYGLLHITGTPDASMALCHFLLTEEASEGELSSCPLEKHLNRHFILFLPNQRCPSGHAGCIFQMLDHPLSPL